MYSSPLPDNKNILPIVPGQYVAEALGTLPDASTATGELVETGIHVPGLGKVKFSCRRLSSRKGRTRRWFWVAERAVQVG